MSIHSYLNASYRGNSEASVEVHYTLCTFGGVSTNAATYPYAANTSLGNTGNGLQINASTGVHIVACTSRKNSVGCSFANSCSGEVVAGRYSDNVNYGISCDTGSQGFVRVTSHPIMGGNGVDFQYPVGAGQTYGIQAIPPGPAFPATGVSVMNKLLLDVMIYITAGAGTIAIVTGGGAIATIPANAVFGFKLPVGQSYTRLSRSLRPQSTWWRSKRPVQVRQRLL